MTKSRTIVSARAGWQKWVEPWYMVYAILGAVVAGLIPVLLPLKVDHVGNPSQVGWVMAAVSLGACQWTILDYIWFNRIGF